MASLLYCCSLLAQSEPARGNLTPPNFENFGVKDGLSNEIYSTIGMDPSGFVWAGSASGVYRFDGYRWSSFLVTGANSLVRDMLSDPEGHLWAIFESEGLAVFRDGQWSLSGDGAFFHRFSTSIEGGGKPQHWLNNSHRILRLDDDRWVEESAPPGEGQLIATAITERLGGERRQWAARSRESLWYRAIDDPDANWIAADLGETGSALFTDLIVSEYSGLEELWILTYGGGIMRLRSDGAEQRWRKGDGQLPTEAIYSGVVTYDEQQVQSLWIASRGGLVHFRGEGLQVYDRRDGLPSNAVRGIKTFRGRDGSDVLWLATEQGISRARLSPSAWRTVSRIGASENGVFGAFATTDQAGNERVVVGSGMDGMAVFADGEWRHYRASNSALPDNFIRGTWPTASSSDLGLVSMDNGQLLTLSDALELIPLPIPWTEGRLTGAIDVIEVDDETWVATQGGAIYRLGDRNLQAVLPPIGPDFLLQAVAIQPMADGSPWLWGVGRAGLVRFNAAERALLPEFPGQFELSLRHVEVVSVGNRTELWISTDRNGVVRLDVSDPLNPTCLPNDDLPAPPDPTIYSVTADSQGRIYVCTNNGVQLLRVRPEGGFSERVFRRQDGLVHDECNSRGQFVDERDRFWAGTLAGLSVYDPTLEQSETRTREPSPLYLTGIEIDRESVAVEAEQLLRIPASAETLTIHTTLLSNHRERENRYLMTLEGTDTPIAFWSQRPDRTWPAPAPGRYSLRIEAEDFAGIRANPIELQMEVQAAWFERSWVQLVLLMLLFLAALGIGALYNRRLLQQQAALKELVEQRTKDLESANYKLVELSFEDALTGTANRRRLDLAGADTLNRAAEQGQSVCLILLDLDYFKEFNDQHGHLAGDLALKCVADQLKQAMRPGDLIARFGGEEFACLLPNTTLTQAEQIAERARQAVHSGSREALANRFSTLTISAGVAEAQPGESSLEVLINRADQALYRAKHEGRNQVISADSLTSTLRAH
ncbi:MAG: diguanylate cyclase [Pseudomonadota bacterium]